MYEAFNISSVIIISEGAHGYVINICWQVSDATGIYLCDPNDMCMKLLLGTNS